MHDTLQPGAVSPTASTPGRRLFRLPGRAKAALVILLILAVGSAVVLGGGYYQASGVSSDYQAARARLTSDIGAAQADGMTAAEITSFTSQLTQVDSRRPSLPSGMRLSLDRSDIDALNQLDAQLKTSQATILLAATEEATTNLASANSALSKDKDLGVPDTELAPLTQQLNDLNGAKGSAKSIKDWRDIGAKAATVQDSLAKTGATQQQENTAIQAAASSLITANGSDAGKIAALGNAALTQGRNDASVAAYEAKPGRFPKIDEVMSNYNRIEYYAPKLGGGDVNQVATATAAIQRYGGNVHNLLMANLGPKHVIVSWTDQHVWAYENGNLVMENAVTTGVRGVTAYGTDFGPMKILFRSHPWKMHSPWPRGSQFWYPDTVVQWTAFFTNSGESFHDASWQSDSTLGPGSQNVAAYRSHGCIHIPYAKAQWMFNWAVEGTPVDVYPGNGQPVAEQLSEMTTDDQGTPLNPAGR
ncbi:MAG: L,D-transpeptidase [Candidatus Dormiibacterota bacterium]